MLCLEGAQFWWLQGYISVSFLSASAISDFQLALELFAAKCEVLGIEISTFKSERMVLSEKVGALLTFGVSCCLKWMSFSILGSYRRGEMEPNVVRCRVGSNVYWSLVVKRELFTIRFTFQPPPVVMNCD